MIDIIVPAYGHPDITFRCLAAIEMFAPKDHRVVLVDNGSEDAVQAFKDLMAARGHTYIRLEPNRGPYGAVNAALKVATAEFVAVVCNDIALLPGSMQAMLELCTEDRPYIGATGILAGAFDFYRCMTEASCRGLFNHRALYPGPCFSCFVAKRSLFSEDHVGLFDERFGLTFGDTDHEQRCADAGVPLLLASHALVFHGHGTTRRRGGLDADLKNDMRDYNAFVDKYRNRPDVLAKHPRETEEQKRTATAHFWKDGER